MNLYRKIGGNQGGIVSGSFISTPAIASEPFTRTMTTRMPAYHKLFLDPMLDVQYHLAGYGMSHEEALIKLIGESIERYAALVVMRMFEDQIRYASYAELHKSDTRCLPLEFLAIFDEAQQRQMHRGMEKFSPELPKPTDTIAWIECPSLTSPGENVWIPTQMMFLGFKSDTLREDKLFVPCFSTGTAAHLTLEKALENALIEAIQIDAAMLNWYADAPGKIVVFDDDELDAYFTDLRLGASSHYEVRPIYISRPELPLPNVIVYLIRKDSRVPYIAAGVQAAADPHYAIMRGTQESLGVLTMGLYGAIHASPEFYSISAESPFLDLDTNVYFYAHPAGAATKRSLIDARANDRINLEQIEPWASDDELMAADLISALSSVSEWAVYLDITPVELHDSAWRVVRTFVPDLCSLCLPGMPPRRHPRFRQYGGVTHERPHPLP